MDNRLVFPVKYAANAFTGKTCYRDTWRRTERRCCSAIQRLVQRMRVLTYRRRRPLLLPRDMTKRPSATFAPRRSLARKRWRGIDRPLIVNLAASRTECATDAFTEETTSRSSTSENMPTRRTKHRLATTAPFVRRGFTTAVISESTSRPTQSPPPPPHCRQHVLPAHWRHQPPLSTPTHERVRPSYRPAYQRIVVSAIGTTGLRSGQANGVESAS